MKLAIFCLDKLSVFILKFFGGQVRVVGQKAACFVRPAKVSFCALPMGSYVFICLYFSH